MQVDIYGYLDARRFLADWFEARKAANPRLSHRWFARKVGTSDPNVLRSVVQGRRNLGPGRIDAFATALDLDEDESRYFRLLVEHTQSPVSDARQRARAALDTHRAKVQPPLADLPLVQQYASTWRHAAVRELMRCPRASADPTWIAKRFDPPWSEAQAQASLDLLLELDLLVRTPDGRLVPGDDEVLATASTVSLLATRTYHEQTDALARQALFRLDELEDETFFVGQTLSLPRSEFKNLRRDIWEAFHRVASKAETWPEPDHVVQLNVRLFPLVRTTEDGLSDR